MASNLNLTLFANRKMISNCNPLNLRHSASNHWLGELEPIRGFCRFENMTLGFRAALLTMRTYLLSHRLNTIEKIINRWAPPADGNDTEHYIRWVCHRVGVGGRDCLWWGDTRLREIIWAMALMESGTDVLAFRDELDEAWQLLEVECRF